MMCWASSPALIAGRDEEPLSRASPKRSRKSNPNISRRLAGALNVVLPLIAVGEVGRLSHLPAALSLRHASPITVWLAAAGGMPAGRADRSRNGFRRSLVLESAAGNGAPGDGAVDCPTGSRRAEIRWRPAFWALPWRYPGASGAWVTDKSGADASQHLPIKC